jgi:hypothetical protein
MAHTYYAPPMQIMLQSSPSRKTQNYQIIVFGVCAGNFSSREKGERAWDMLKGINCIINTMKIK